MNPQLDVMVVGAGLAGLACAARLRRLGVVNFRVVEQGNHVGSSWRRHYQSLSMNSPYHRLPDDDGLRDAWGMFMARAEWVTYLERYAALHHISEWLELSQNVVGVRRTDREWQVDTTTSRYRSRYLVVATAVNRLPCWPRIQGSEKFTGRILHSSQYWNAEPFRAQRVLVVGSGNSAADIALDLSRGGAEAVELWVRGPRHVLDRERFARAVAIAQRLSVAFTWESLVAGHQYTRIHPEFRQRLREQDAFLEQCALDVSCLGIGTPTEGPATQQYTVGREPWYDHGTVRGIESGQVQVIDGNVDAIEAWNEHGVEFTTRSRPFDAVILATGFQPGLDEFVEDNDMLLTWDPRRRGHMPKTNGRCRSAVEPSLFFPGFDETPNAGLSLGLWGAEAADTIASELVE